MSRLIRSRECISNHSKPVVEKRRQGDCDMNAKLRTEVGKDGSVLENTKATVVVDMGLWKAR